MRRREFIALTGAAAVMWPPLIRAQQRGTRLIGYVTTAPSPMGMRRLACFKQGLRDLGWAEGQDLVIEHRWTGPRSLAEIAAELTSLPVEVIVTTGTPVSQYMRRAIEGVPRVFMMVSDPVTSSLVTNLARPESNVTGISNLLPATASKLPELLKEALPGLSRIAFLYDPSNHGKVLEREVIKAAGAALGITIEPRELRALAGIDATFGLLARNRPDALIVPVDGVTVPGLKRIVELAAKNTFPAIYQTREFVEAGGLMSYGLNDCQHHRRGAYYVDRILRGANPADLPVEQPTTFELVINLKTAKALGIEVPATLIARADEVIE